MNVAQNPIDIDQLFLDFMAEKYKKEHHGDDKSLILVAPLPKIGTKDKFYTLPELIDEMRVRNEAYFRIMYTWFYNSFGQEFEAYKKYK
ncbi:MAG: hypothetical protein Q8R47_03560 [Nanoarchaeota archaeon]|nr:hypothetical protein [Nanoarchaeota archaeon]